MTNENPDASTEQPPDNGRGRPNAIVGADRVLQRRVFTLNAGAAAGQVGAIPAIIDRQALGFMAASIRIDNLSHQWYYIRGVEQWVPAGQVGMVIRCNQLEVADVRALTPTGFTSAPVDGETVVIVFEESRFEPNAGFNLFIAGGMLPPDTPSDTEANQAGLPVVAFNKVWNPALALWQMMRAALATGGANGTTGLPATVNHLWNGAAYIPQNVQGADGTAGAQFPGVVLYAINTVNGGIDRLRTIAATGQGLGVLNTARATNWTRITTATTTVVKASQGVLNRIVVPVASTGTITIYDNTSAAGTIINILPIGTVGSFTYETRMGTGITIVTAAADEVGVGWY